MMYWLLHTWANSINYLLTYNYSRARNMFKHKLFKAPFVLPTVLNHYTTLCFICLIWLKIISIKHYCWVHSNINWILLSKSIDKGRCEAVLPNNKYENLVKDDDSMFHSVSFKEKSRNWKTKTCPLKLIKRRLFKWRSEKAIVWYVETWIWDGHELVMRWTPCWRNSIVK